MNRTNVFLIVAVLAVVLGLSACAVKQDDSVIAPVSDEDLKAELIGKVWVAEYILGQPVIDMSHSSMVFSESDQVKGSGGCNSFGGNYTLKDGMLTFGPLATTLRMCGEALDAQEKRFFQLLATPQAVRYEHGILHLTPVEGQPSRFAVQN